MTVNYLGQVNFILSGINLFDGSASRHNDLQVWCIRSMHMLILSTLSIWTNVFVLYAIQAGYLGGGYNPHVASITAITSRRRSQWLLN
jgi:hypothetical protein